MQDRRDGGLFGLTGMVEEVEGVEEGGGGCLRCLSEMSKMSERWVKGVGGDDCAKGDGVQQGLGCCVPRAR